MDNDPRSPLYDPQLDTSHVTLHVATSRLPIEAIGWHQRLVVNPLVAILCSLAGVALIQHALRTRNVVLFGTAVGVLFLSLLLIQFHCRDCGATGWYLHAGNHACAAVVARWRQNALGAIWIESQNAASDLDLRHGLQSSRVRGVHAFADVRRVGIGSGRSGAVPIPVPRTVWSGPYNYRLRRSFFTSPFFPSSRKKNQ